MFWREEILLALVAWKIITLLNETLGGDSWDGEAWRFVTAGKRRQASCQPAAVRLQDRCSAMETREEAALSGELAEPQPLSAPGGGAEHGRRLPPVGWRLPSSCALLPRDGRAQRGSAVLLWQVCRERTRGSRCGLQHREKFWLDSRDFCFLTLGVVKHWSRLLREAGKSPSSEIKELALHNLIPATCLETGAGPGGLQRSLPT